MNFTRHEPEAQAKDRPHRQRWANFIRDRLVYVKAVAVLIWLAWLVSLSFSGFTRDIEGKPIGTDHIAFYSAAKLIDEGRGNLIYDYSFLKRYQPTLIGMDGEFLDAYRNPPFYALIYVPTSRLTYLGSFWIWTAISLLMLWLGIRWLEPSKPFAVFLLSLSFYPVFAAFSFGQNSLLSFGLFCAAFQLLQRKRFILAGAVAGLLLYKPQLLLGLGIWWVLSFRTYWKCLLGLTISGLFWLTVSLICVPVETRQFVEKLREIAAYDAFHFWNMHNARAFGTLISFDNKEVGNIFGLIGSVAGIACFVFLWKRCRDRVAIMFAGAVFLTLWSSPHTLIYEWSLALIPAILLWEHAPEHRDDWLIMFAACWIALFISTPIAKGLVLATVSPETHHGWAIQVSVPVLAACAIWALLILTSRHQPEASARTSARPR